MSFAKSLIIVVLTGQAVALAAAAGERASVAVPGGLKQPSQRAARSARTAAPLDRVADAVDSAESSHGQDLAMWRPDPSGPQGPMQVSEAAATDVGGGDRFDLMQNRALGRAYLSQLFGRYRNWPDAIAAYNWGLGKMDAWVKAGRPPDKFVAGVALYLKRVLHQSGLCEGVDAMPAREGPIAQREPNVSLPDSLVYAACSALGPSDATGTGIGPSRFYKKLDAGLELALKRAAQDR